MERVTKDAIRRHKLRLVLGHRDLSPDRDHDGVVEPFEWVKVCPCFDAAPEYGALLGPVKARQQTRIIKRRKARKGRKKRAK
jgi:N-acetyl-anhydromuramyl-L-alanine amidase AmpD